jgi:tetratricopeptide (TPR) repeat protein
MGDINRLNYGLANEKLAEAGRAADQIQPADAQTLALQGFVAKSRAQVAQATNRRANARQFYQQAAGLFQKAVALDPDNASAHNGLGNVAYALGDLEGAIQAYQRALALAPTYAAAWYDLGGAYMARMRAEPAQADRWRQAALDAFRQARQHAEGDPGFGPDALRRLDGYIADLEGR